ncbi:MAG: Spore protein SP21 [bacterium ADurb.Bin157]|nr:MAG: Spore protein SP21 [bacterium ADurb.Bin157]
MAEKTIPNTKNNETQMVKREVTREPDSFITPLTDIYEEENGLKLVADLPGVDKEGLKLSVDKNILTIEGHITPDLDTGFLMREYEPSNYFRQFELAESVDQENINAELNNGVLKVFLPFAKETQPRMISVKIH